jgi:peptidyl-prolyl cis-trans isomerase SurA
MKRLLLAATLAALVGVGLRAEILEQVIVKVNGDILTKSELEQRQVAALRARNRGAATLDLKNDAELKKLLDEVTPQIIVDTIDEILIMQQGKERGYRLTDEQFKSIVERIRKENKLEDDQQFEAALKQEGITMADLRKSMERQMVVSRVQTDAVGRISVTEEEARQYYEGHKGEFAVPASLTLREVLVEVPTSGTGVQALFNVASDEDAKRKAETLRAEAVAGADFATLATEQSAAPSKANGGLIGPLSRDELQPVLQKLIDPLEVGGVTEVVRMQRGYQFFKLESLTPSATKPFDQAREDIVNKVYAQRRAVEFRKYLQRLRGQAIIEWKNEELHKLYDRQLAADSTTAPPVS